MQFEDRAMSGFPISISTALALESIFPPRQNVYDPERKIPEHVDVNKYQEIWINVWTLYRNLVSATPKEVVANTDGVEVCSVLQAEMEVINSLFANEGNNVCKPMYYHCDYDKLFSGLPGAIKPRLDVTPNQKFLMATYLRMLNQLHKNTDTIIEFKPEIKPTTNSDALIITHVPYDLTSFHRFHSLSLLESNTGKLKTRRAWNTKYYKLPNKEMTILPFFKRLLFIFGDSSLIQPSLYKLRQQIFDIAEKRNWTPMTTMSKIMMDIELDIKEPYVLDFIRSIPN